MKKAKVILVFILITHFYNGYAQNNSSLPLPSWNLGVFAFYNIPPAEEGGFGIAVKRDIKTLGVSLGLSGGSNNFPAISFVNLDVDLHYLLIVKGKLNLYALAGFNINTDCWMGFYEKPFLTNTNLWGGINTGAGIEFNLKYITLYSEVKKIIFNQEIYSGVAGFSYCLNKKRKTVKSRSLK